MCAQCWAAAGTAVAGALRAWAAAVRPPWLDQRRLRVLTVALMSLAVAIASVRIT
jgi:hypothetical protein